jgi:hypothetical protein
MQYLFLNVTMQIWRNCQVLSEQTSDSWAFLNAMWILNYVLKCEQHFSIFIFRFGYRSRSPGFDSLHYQIFWVVGLERGPLSLVSTTEVLLGRKSSGSGLESREYSDRDPSRWPRGTLYPQKLALTSLTSGDRSVGIVRLRTQATECSFSFLFF